MGLEETVTEAFTGLQPEYAVRRRKWVVFLSSRIAAWHTLFFNRKLSIEGKTEEVRQVLRAGNYAIAAKHRHNFDPINVYRAIHYDTPEPPWPFAKKEFYELRGLLRIQSWWYRNIGTIPIDRPEKDGTNKTDIALNTAAIQRAQQLLLDGKSVAFFPEGHRYPVEMGRCYPFIPGALQQLYVEHRLDIPVLTVGSIYENPDKPFKGVSVIRFGPVLRPSQFVEGKSPARDAVRFTYKIRESLAEASGFNKTPA